jgi:hypothetical protein
MKTRSNHGRGSCADPDAAPSTHTETPSRSELLAFDPLSPVIGRPVRESPSRAELLALDPLGAIPRFNRPR